MQLGAIYFVSGRVLTADRDPSRGPEPGERARDFSEKLRCSGAPDVLESARNTTGSMISLAKDRTSGASKHPPLMLLGWTAGPAPPAILSRNGAINCALLPPGPAT